MMATAPVPAQAEQENDGIAATRPVPIKGRRRNLGRQARKRRKKYLEIEAAASAFIKAATSALETSTATTETSTTETASAGETSHKEASGKTKVLPTDRGYVLEDVHSVLSQVDRRELIRQLGYLPGNALKVVARIEDAFSKDDLQRLFAAATVPQSEKATPQQKDIQSKQSTTSSDSSQTKERAQKMAMMIQNMMKEPLVIKLYPLALRDESSSTKRRRKRRREEIEDDSADATPSEAAPLMEPFPTIYWVTHPLIKALISKLELDRVNVQFEKRLEEAETKPSKTDECVLESMKRAHTAYGKERRALLSSKDMDYVKGRKWYGDEPTASCTLPASKASIPPFSERCGVAGIRNPKAVKCLHAHAAHYWSGNSDNVVGQWVWERLRSSDSFFQGSIEDEDEDNSNVKNP